jgi:hypothetical protein
MFTPDSIKEVTSYRKERFTSKYKRCYYFKRSYRKKRLELLVRDHKKSSNECRHDYTMVQINND